MEKYKCVKILGRGAYGAASLVSSVATGEFYVIKEVNIYDLSEEESQKAVDEVKHLKKLNHPNIVGYIEAFVDEKFLKIVMEFADGGDLEKLIAKRTRPTRRPLSEDKVCGLTVQVMLAIKHLHDKKMIHRDLKPSNIFLTKAGEVKLGDFGVSRVVDTTGEFANTVIGTPHYLSPEICATEGYNQQSDMWSLGVILYELMCLKHCFDAPNVPALVMLVMQGRYEPIPEDSGYSKELIDVCSALLIKDHTARMNVTDALNTPIMRRAFERYAKFKLQKQKTLAESVPIAGPSPVTAENYDRRLASFLTEAGKYSLPTDMESSLPVLSRSFGDGLRHFAGALDSLAATANPSTDDMAEILKACEEYAKSAREKLQAR